MKAIVLLNRSAGAYAAMNGNQGTRAVADALSAAGVEADVRVVVGKRLPAEAQAAAASAVDVVVAGGGDGTLSTVANVLAGKQAPLGILPLGTLNHFAKDLGIPLDLEGAARVIAAWHVGSVDVGEVNGRVFINNSSLGLYPRVVLERESLRHKHRLSKWTAMAMAVVKVFHRFPMVEVRIATDTDIILRKTPLVFIGNNCYQLDLLHIGTRARVNRGELSLYIAIAQDRWGALKLTLRAIFGGLEQARDFETFCLSNCEIKARRHRLHVAVDGEVVKLEPPLRYQVHARALRVCLPADLPEDPGSRPTDMTLNARLESALAGAGPATRLAN